MISLKQAERFHGHLGPWLVLGVLSGGYALEKLKARKYFGLKVKVWGAQDKPRSCLVDGLQLSTGATYGKGNILKLNGPAVKVEFTNCKNDKRVTLRLKTSLIAQLNEAKTHPDAEALARKLYGKDADELFDLNINP